MANTTLPPIPYKTKIITETGYLSPAWSKFILFLFERTGGTEAVSNTDLQISVAENSSFITDLENRMSANEQGPT